jgi:hypothetical protein
MVKLKLTCLTKLLILVLIMFSTTAVLEFNNTVYAKTVTKTDKCACSINDGATHYYNIPDGAYITKFVWHVDGWRGGRDGDRPEFSVYKGGGYPRKDRFLYFYASGITSSESNFTGTYNTDILFKKGDRNDNFRVSVDKGGPIKFNYLIGDSTLTITYEEPIAKVNITNPSNNSEFPLWENPAISYVPEFHKEAKVYLEYYNNNEWTTISTDNSPVSDTTNAIIIPADVWRTFPSNAYTRVRIKLEAVGASSTSEIQIKRANEKPTMSPLDGGNYHHTERPRLTYRVYDGDGDSLTTNIQYDNNGTWVTLYTKSGLSHGNTVDYTLTQSQWSQIPINTNTQFRVKVYDGQEYAYTYLTIRRTNASPTVQILSPGNGSSFTSDEPPVIETKVSDTDNDPITATVEYDNNGNWQGLITVDSLTHNETVNIQIPETKWRALPYHEGLKLRVKAYDGIEYGYSASITLTKPNTPPVINMVSPVPNQSMICGYMPFAWTIEDIDHDDINLKIWTDTDNIMNDGVLYDDSIGAHPYIEDITVHVYFPVGEHTVYLQWDDGYHILQETRVINILENVDVSGSDYPTFYIPVFELEKSSYYYNKINAMIEDETYLLNILKNPANERYLSGIEGIVNITNSYVYESDYLYNTDGTFDEDKITDWVFLKASTEDNPVIRVVETGTGIILKNIEFSDDEKDYTDIDPYRGRNRQFHFAHYPQIYENADSEMQNNNEWVLDESFTVFDGRPVERIDGQDENIRIYLNKSGKYIVTLKEQDLIINPDGIDMSKFSHPRAIEVYAHRRPVAVLNYEENGGGSVRLTSSSYDMDFETRTDKGIAQELYEYRLLNLDYTLHQDWVPVPDISNFSPDKSYITEVRLTVTDYGALIELENDGELTNTASIIFDDIGRPPIADFSYKVGKTAVTSVTAGSEMYRGNWGEETLQLEENVQWNDFFGTGNRVINWSKDANQLREEAKTQAHLETTLTVTNRYGLEDNVTKSMAVKEIQFDNYTPGTVFAGKEIMFDIRLTSPQPVDKWANFEVRITAPDLGLDEYTLQNTISNRFIGTKPIFSYLEGETTYTVKVYSRRTGELIARQNVTLEILNLKVENFRITDIVNHPEWEYGYNYPIAKNDLPVDYKAGYYATFRVNTIGEPENVRAIVRIDGITDKTISMTYIDTDGDNQIWEGRYYAEATTPEGSVITMHVTASKDTEVYDYNAEETWDGVVLIVEGSALQDGRINRTN